MRYLITGGCGFVGSNLAAEVLKRGEELFIIDNLFRHGSNENLTWLRSQGEFKYYPYDTRNINDVETVIKAVKPNYIFHLAGQVAMTTLGLILRRMPLVHSMCLIQSANIHRIR